MKKLSDYFLYYLKYTDGQLVGYAFLDLEIYPAVDSLFFLNNRPSAPLPATGGTFTLTER